MRRSDREIDLNENLENLLETLSVIRIGGVDEQGPYIVPMNYGFETDGKTTVFYLHSARAGRKVSLFDQGGTVAFELDGNHELTTGQDGCDYSYNYLSIIGQGIIAPIEDEVKKAEALLKIVTHYEKERDDIGINEKMVKLTKVYQLTVTEISGKQRNV